MGKKRKGALFPSVARRRKNERVISLFVLSGASTPSPRPKVAAPAVAEATDALSALSLNGMQQEKEIKPRGFKVGIFLLTIKPNHKKKPPLLLPPPLSTSAVMRPLRVARSPARKLLSSSMPPCPRSSPLQASD